MTHRLEERLQGMTGSVGEAGPLRCVRMPGSPYTGSTLLGLLLNNHPECASIGAATGLTAKIDLETYACSCGVRFTDCGFWDRIPTRTVELGHPVTVFKEDFWNSDVRLSRRRWLNGLLVRSLGSSSLTAARDAVVRRSGSIRRRTSEARMSTWSLARAVLEATGKTVFVDTARDHQRPQYVMGSPMLDLRVIHPVRDPCGTAASIMKHTGGGVSKPARPWRHYNLEADRLKRLLPARAWMLLHYDELRADPQPTLDRIARFIRGEPEPVPQNLQLVEKHIIGNSMRVRAVGEIREDRTWRGVLQEDDRRVIVRIAGSATHQLGYDWP